MNEDTPLGSVWVLYVHKWVCYGCVLHGFTSAVCSVSSWWRQGLTKGPFLLFTSSRRWLTASSCSNLFFSETARTYINGAIWLAAQVFFQRGHAGRQGDPASLCTARKPGGMTLTALGTDPNGFMLSLVATCWCSWLPSDASCYTGASWLIVMQTGS